MESQATPAAAVAAAQALRVIFGRLRRRLQDASAVGELTSAQASALARLAANEPSSTSTLAGAERVRPQSMAATMAALEKQGLVRREDDPGDGRRQLLFLTPAGRAYAQGARASREEWLARTLAQRLTEDELAVVNEAMVLLERIVEP
ncbi:MarR family winged helix-turn-helix transcriptional regulator [Frankia tisae]|uniref:MarR family winged helix-turn-helix transcriptional regulator n=1 Tax=Frankia tisae TaxID=2950104 RepID=UPI0021C181DA|nr:MarR family transcriptional regulator [Frankia tisae]